MTYNIELCKENEYFCAYIGEDNGSGYVIRENSKSECINKIAYFFESYGNWEEDLEEEE